jgi:23S rRNA pseudouridine1911/1915/1917 synthase
MKDIEIIYEDDNMLAINKPVGLVVHFDGKTSEETVCDFVLEKYPDIKGVGEPMKLKDGSIIDRPGIVHRLDRDTSGVLVIAKNQDSYENIKEQFKNRETEKTYNTFVYGNIKDNERTINKPIGRSNKDFRQWSASKGARGELREAETHLKVLKRGVEEGEHFTYLEVKPKTGRTHQIRVHLKVINNPVICDKLYAPNRSHLLGFERLALHASNLKLKNFEGEIVEITATYPEDFKKAVNSLA